ncbi:hypothetical protein [Catellatospora vulcania]|uniref:hypothetical protein n=1 Tax=Catellatospora vulcania TaxID=1460450 RepID=UPI0012D3D083|nr:hypothetical protein [Catellatospora vulcania]
MKRTVNALLTAGAVLASVLLPTAATAATPHSSTAAHHCGSVRPATDFYAAGRVATVLLTVPNNPSCKTISVSHLKDPTDPSDRCQVFLVIFYPTDGSEPIATEPVNACFHGPRSRPVVLATAVPDGSQYRVLYQIDYLIQHLTFKVWH